MRCGIWEEVTKLSEESLPERIRRRSDDLSGSQKKVARFCVSDPRRAGTLTALRIADELKISESTVVRFAVRMGYLGFPDMQAAIRQAAQHRDAPVGHDELREDPGNFAVSFQHDVRLLRETIGIVDEERLNRAVAALDEADAVHVVGFRSAFSLSYLAEYHIRQVRPHVRLVGAVGGTSRDDQALIQPKDALLAFTFPVYDDRSIEVIEAAAAAGAECVVVTDSALAPLPLGENVHTLIARHEGLSFFNSDVAPVAIINAIVMRMVALRTEREPGFSRTLNERFHRERARRT